MRGIEAGLDGGLIGRAAEVREEVADLLLAGCKDLPRRGLVDSGGDCLAELLEAGLEPIAEGIGGELGLRIQTSCRKRRGCGHNLRRNKRVRQALQTG